MAERDYSHVPLWKKLGVVDGARVRLIGRPRTVAELETLPSSAHSARTDLDVILIFETQHAKLIKTFAPLIPSLSDRGGLWVSWPKKTSEIAHDLEFDMVQKIGLGNGLVDNKVCRIDDDWQAIRFVRRLKK